jgi:hypothetical protein
LQLLLTTSKLQLISCKWVVKLKYTNDVYEKHKARIVARGFE